MIEMNWCVTMPMPLLDIHSLTFAVDHHAILDQLDLAIESHEIHAILGANGSGKTTLAYVLMGCEGYAPSAGTVLFDGTDLLPMKMHERARLGLTLAWQEPARFEGVTVREYLTLGKPDCDAEPGLRQVGLAPDRYLHRRMDKALSGGERHRIELASVLSMKPKLAILDEPSAGIDHALDQSHCRHHPRPQSSRRIGPLDYTPGRGRAHRRPSFTTLRRAHHFLRQSTRSRRSFPRADLRSLRWRSL